MDSRTEFAYTSLRQRIESGVLRPNSRLVAAKLADELGTSRTPIRDALLRLADEGLVNKEPSGWVVHEHSKEEIREIYEVRAALEGFAARLTAGNASDEYHARIAALLPEGPAGSDDVPATLSERDTAFHWEIVKGCGNSRLLSAIESTRDYYFQRKIIAMLSYAPTPHQATDHKSILEAILDRDPDAADLHTRAHLMSSLDAVLDRI